MGTSLSKTQLLAELRHEQASWEALLDEIGEAHMTQPEVAGGWSIKDIVAHLTGWRRRSVRRFQALLHHEPDFSPPWPTELQEDDEINAWIYEANRDRPLAEVLSDSREAFQQLVETLDAFSEDELQDLRRTLGLEEEQVSGSMFARSFPPGARARNARLAGEGETRTVTHHPLKPEGMSAFPHTCTLAPGYGTCSCMELASLSPRMARAWPAASGG